ncbi:hypothetical protein KU6B_46990 [Mameliella alba]|uniref:hypothetical protein n=1 Tax=Mameliella alba TaxID=561184 RepID=UPI0013E50BC7|nr:hypothetical protein [Mameliella alba]BBU58434.1 hypothetical protein KU6B_46990 [Mameliella alba]
MSSEKSFVDQIVEQIQSTVRDMEDSGFLDELAHAPEKTEMPQAQETEAPKDTDRQRDKS